MWDIFSAQCLHNSPSLTLLTEVAVPYFFFLDRPFLLINVLPSYLKD